MSPTPESTRIGVLGAGDVSRDIHLPALANIPGIRVAWVCDRDESAARRLARTYRIRDAFSRIEDCPGVDVVLVAVPVGARATVVPAVLERGWHAFCEKPFASTLDVHDRILAEARARGLQVGVGLVRRYAPATRQLRRLVESRRFGPIVRAWASEGIRTTRTGRGAGWYGEDPHASGGGVLMETGTHLVDQLFHVLGATDFRLDESRQVRSHGLDFESRLAGEVATGAQATIPCAVEVSWIDDLCNGLTVEFEDVLLRAGPYFADPLHVCAPDGAVLRTLVTEEGAQTVGSACFFEWRDFLEQCATGQPSVVDAETGRLTTSAIERVYRAGSRDEPVRAPAGGAP